ncbi:MAG: antibiotic biosynthesis monooxygenase family protein [Thermoplasmatota archaeon]
MPIDPLILRVYHARTQPGMDGDFEHFLREVAIPLMKKQPGFVDAQVGRTRWGGPAGFVVASRWDRLESLKAFVGEKWQDPIILPEEQHMVKQVSVEHYETLDF